MKDEEIKKIKHICKTYLAELSDSLNELHEKLKKDVPNEVKMNISGIIMGLEEAETTFRIVFKDFLREKER